MKKENNNIGFKIFLIALLAFAVFYFYKTGQFNNLINKPNGVIDNKKDDTNKDNKSNNDTKVKENIVEKNTYLNKVTNNSGITIKDGWQDIIVKYLDLYTKSLVKLETQDISSLFTNPNGIEEYITYSTIDFQVEHHKMQPNDMKLSDASYNIEYKNVNINGNKVTIKFLEDDFYKFNFMGDIQTKIIDVENTVVINKSSEGIYTLDSLRVVRDNYIMFTNVVDSNSSKTTIDNLKQKYLNWDREEVEKNIKLLNEANSKEYVTTKKCNHSYDRNLAVNYANKYADDRNSDYYDYSKLGGNCVNYVSQSIHAGGVPMDYTGSYQWKHYSSALNEANTASGRSNSWTAVSYFYNYAKNNTGFGMCAVTDINIFYAEGGDVIQVGYNGFTHATLAVGQVKKDGKILDIMLNSNTVGLENYPLLGYTYQNKRLIKVLGYND